jgi:hypothetical protein
MAYDSQSHEMKNTAMIPVGLRTKKYCAGEDQQKFTPPDIFRLSRPESKRSLRPWEQTSKQNKLRNWT